MLLRKSRCALGIVVMLIFSAPLIALGKVSIKYVGSSTVGKFMYEAEKIYTNANFSINTKPESGGGEIATASGANDIGGVAREIKPGILEKGVKKYLIGKDAIGVWVNASNTVTSLTQSQIKGIFTGSITNWKEVGGHDAPINVYIVNPNSATRKVFSKAILGSDNYGGNVGTIRPDSSIIDRLAGDKNGIGHLSFALGNTHNKAAKVRKIDIDGQKATVDNPDYPITRPLYLITKGDPPSGVKNFIEWSLSEAGQQIVKKYLKALGLYESGKSVHALRHSYAVQLYAQEKDLRTVQKQLRHRSIKNTQIYADVSNEAIKAQVRRLWG